MCLDSVGLICVKFTFHGEIPSVNVRFVSGLTATLQYVQASGLRDRPVKSGQLPIFMKQTHLHH